MTDRTASAARRTPDSPVSHDQGSAGPAPKEATVALAQDRPATPALPNARTAGPSRPSGPPPRPELTSDVVPPWLRSEEESRPWAVLAAALLVVAAAAAG